MRGGFVLGGVVAGATLILLGVGSIVVGASGRSEVQDRIADEQIVGTPDMTPDATQAAVEEAGLTDVEIPDCSVADEEIDTGSEAKCFASYMRIHALESTGGKVYSEMPRAVDTKTGKPVPEDKAAVALENGTAIDNPERQTWVTETALATALNTSYFAEQVSNFGIAMGIALVLIGIGLLVLTFGALRPRLASREGGSVHRRVASGQGAELPRHRALPRSRGGYPGRRRARRAGRRRPAPTGPHRGNLEGARRLRSRELLQKAGQPGPIESSTPRPSIPAVAPCPPGPVAATSSVRVPRPLLMDLQMVRVPRGIPNGWGRDH